jgi:hypothetical protein
VDSGTHFLLVISLITFLQTIGYLYNSRNPKGGKGGNGGGALCVCAESINIEGAVTFLAALHILMADARRGD